MYCVVYSYRNRKMWCLKLKITILKTCVGHVLIRFSILILVAYTSDVRCRAGQ